MSLVALKFVWAALITLTLVTLIWLAAEMREAPAGVKRAARWILGLALVIGLAAVAGPVVGGLLWWSFGK